MSRLLHFKAHRPNKYHHSHTQTLEHSLTHTFEAFRIISWYFYAYRNIIWPSKKCIYDMNTFCFIEWRSFVYLFDFISDERDLLY